MEKKHISISRKKVWNHSFGHDDQNSKVLGWNDVFVFIFLFI